MDELLIKLSVSGVGCYIGNTYCRSLGYADDVILSYINSNEKYAEYK